MIPPQRIVKAARLLLEWTQQDLADHAGISIGSISRFEAGASLSKPSMLKVITAFEEEGVGFIFDADDNVVGVRYVGAVLS